MTLKLNSPQIVRLQARDELLFVSNARLAKGLAPCAVNESDQAVPRRHFA